MNTVHAYTHIHLSNSVNLRSGQQWQIYIFRPWYTFFSLGQVRPEVYTVTKCKSNIVKAHHPIKPKFTVSDAKNFF